MQVFVYGPWNHFRIFGVYVFVFYIGKKPSIVASLLGCCLGIQNVIRINTVHMSQALDLTTSLFRLAVPCNKF